MAKKYRLLGLVLYLIAFALLLVLLTRGHTVALLQPQGVIAHQQRNLLAFAFILSMVVIIPVYILAITIAWKYRADNPNIHKGRYTPDWDHNAKLETVWWGIPCAIILVLSIVTWNSSHALDPFRPIASVHPPMTIQVVALDWKWLFIYPSEHIATVNYVRFPVDTPVDFAITSDAPMNSFWIPQLAGQIYAMSGMETHLHIVASNVGSYRGSSANISGRGFSGMNFTAYASSPAEYHQWLTTAKTTSNTLNTAAYNNLQKPSVNVVPQTYGTVDSTLYDTIVLKYMRHAPESAQRTAGNNE